jgi:hypothetical protein
MAQRLEPRFAAGSSVLALGCGDMANALALSARGVRVLVLDPDGARLEAARSEALGLGSAPPLRFELGGAEALRAVARLFDGAYSGPGALAGAAWAELAPALGQLLRSGAPVVLALARPAAGLRGLLGRDFRWERRFALGILVRTRLGGAWAARNPQAFALLAMLERIVRGWLLLRALGEHVVWEGVRR